MRYLANVILTLSLKMTIKHDNISELPGYYISKTGKLYSRYDKSGHITPRISRKGEEIPLKWHRVQVNHNKKGYTFVQKQHKPVQYIHRLVALAYIPNPDPKHKIYVCHKDNDITHNRVSNLYWGTPKENTAQMFRDGHGHFKIDKVLLERLKSDFNKGLTIKDLSFKYKVCKTAIRKAIIYKTRVYL